MKKLIVLLAVLASGAVVDANGRTEPSAAETSARQVDNPANTVMLALRQACTGSSREAAQTWCELAFSP